MTQVIQEKFAAIEPLLNERARRRWAAVEARALGRGGIARVAEATGLSRATISAGLQELAAGPEDDDAAGRLRGPGAGRKALAEHDAGLVAALERLVDPATRGDPAGPLRWTCSSAARLARELQEAGHRVSERSVNRLLHALGYSLQANRKTLEGKQHTDRDAQFNHINRRVRAFQRRRQPVVSVDTKKKELVGPFENAGREWRPRGHPEPVRVHDFPDKALGKAIPYGVYDLTHDAGWVSVGIDHDTASFAVETLRLWRRCPDRTCRRRASARRPGPVSARGSPPWSCRVVAVVPTFSPAGDRAGCHTGDHECWLVPDDGERCRGGRQTPSGFRGLVQELAAG